MYVCVCVCVCVCITFQIILKIKGSNLTNMEKTLEFSFLFNDKVE